VSNCIFDLIKALQGAGGNSTNIVAQALTPLIGTVEHIANGAQQAAATAVNNNTAANPPTDGTVDQ
jgi:hypothetical protein